MVRFVVQRNGKGYRRNTATTRSYGANTNINVPDYAASSADHVRVRIRNFGVFAKG